MKSKPKSFYKLVNELENYFEKEGLTLIDKNVITKAIHNAERFSVCFYYSDENNKRKSAREGKFFEYTLGGIPVNDFTRLEKVFKFFIEILNLYEKEKQSEN